MLQATLSGAFRDTAAVLRLVLLGAGINAVLTPIAVVLLHGGTAGATGSQGAAGLVGRRVEFNLVQLVAVLPVKHVAWAKDQCGELGQY